jgi:sulfatase maturation enzyme AslB (radical SAM superfamily)
MKISSLPRKVIRGLPYLGKEMRAIVSDRTPFFIAVPRTVHIWRDAPCNAKCVMCTYGYLKGEAYKAISRSDFTDDMMPRALSEIHELCGRGTLVSYMGGEPTVSRNVTEWIEQAGELGLDFRFTTNGYVMNEDMARRFVSAGLFNIGVSLESLDPKINEVIRPHPDGTAKTLRCIDLILSERARQKKHVSINVKTVITDINMESFLEIVKRFGKIDGMMCTPQMFEPLREMPEHTKQLLFIKDIDRLQRLTDNIRKLKSEGYAVHVSEQGLNEMVKLYREAKDDTFTMGNEKLEMDPSEPACNIGTDSMWIHNGMVKLCPNHPPIGNMVADTTTTLKQMWESELTKKVRAGTRACRQLCTISCLRRTPLAHKVSTFLKIA